MKKKRITIPNSTKVRAELQREINSSCPFCASTEVGHFELHHIDEDPSNNVISNLLLLCPLCHSKITKGDIEKSLVFEKKHSLPDQKGRDVEFISISVDSENCSWVPIDGVANAFEMHSLKSYNPIFIVTLINHTEKTVLLTGISTYARRLPVGLTGRYTPLPSVLRPTIKYQIEFPDQFEVFKLKLLEELLEVPAGRAFQFQVELYSNKEATFYPASRYALLLKFHFNNSFWVNAPKILLNSNKDYTTLTHHAMN